MRYATSSLRSHHLLTLAVLCLLGIGVLMVQSASLRIGEPPGWFTEDAMKHVRLVAVGLVAYFIAMHLPIERWIAGGSSNNLEADDESRGVPAPNDRTEDGPSLIATLLRAPAFWALLIAGVLSVLVLIPHIGQEVNGARRWIKLGPVQLQPSELAKWSTVIALTWWLTTRPIDLRRFFPGFLCTLAPISVLALLVVIEDFGTAALIGVVMLLMMIVGRMKWWHVALVIPPALAAGAYFVFGTPYRRLRMTGFLDPWADPQGKGYHMVQSLMSFAGGGFTGRGLGNGIQKLGYLPEDTTDFIFAVICEELGFFGAAIVVALFVGIVIVAWRLIKDDRVSPAGKLFTFGVAVTIGLQACINMAVATVSMPTKGMSLPFISAGGTGIILTCAMIGAVASIAKRRPEPAGILEKDNEPMNDAAPSAPSLATA